jgi:uroporphyrinogen-III synthase
VTTLIVTRPEPQAERWVAQLSALGVPAKALPLLQTTPLANDQHVIQAWSDVATVEGVMFVSPAAVHAWMQARPAGLAWPRTTWAAAPGPGTAQALRAQGVATVYEPAQDAEHFDSESLWAALPPSAQSARHVLIVHGGTGRTWLAQQWQQAGSGVRQVQAYVRTAAVLSPSQRAEMHNALQRPEQHAWLLSSSEIVDALAGHARQAATGSADPLQAHWAVCTHPVIVQRAQAAGFGRVTPSQPTVASVAACLQV